MPPKNPNIIIKKLDPAKFKERRRTVQDLAQMLADNEMDDKSKKVS